MGARSFLRGLRSTSSRCTACGSDATYPFPGRLAVLARIVLLERHGCRACRRRFWLPLGVDRRHPPLRAGAPSTTHAHPAQAGATDVATIAAAEVAAPPLRARDLAAIDAALARAGAATPPRTGKRARHRKRR
jgi:hypothetical protein